MLKTKIVLLFLTIVLFPAIATAELATLVFANGKMVVLEGASIYKELDAALKSYRSARGDNAFVTLETRSGTFVINVADVSLMCKQDCRRMFTSSRR